MRGHLRTFVVIGLTVGLMGFFLRNADLGSVWAEIRRARFGLVSAAFAVIALSYVVRVNRWQLLLAPLGHVGFGSAARATVIGFAVTAVLPGRLGELLRPYLLARRERLSASATLATIVLERLLDLIAVVLMLGLFLLLFSDGLPRTDEQVLAALKAGGLVAATGAGMVLALILAAARKPEWVNAGVAQVERRVPGRLGTSASRFITRFSDGLAVVREPRQFLTAFLLSFVLWLLVSVSAWCACLAFSIRLPPSGSLLLTALMALGVAVPTPGGVGGFHAAVQVGLTAFFAAPVDAAVGVALVLHVVTFGPVTVLGIFWMARAGLTFRGAVDLASSGGAGASGADGEKGVTRVARQVDLPGASPVSGQRGVPPRAAKPEG